MRDDAEVVGDGALEVVPFQGQCFSEKTEHGFDEPAEVRVASIVSDSTVQDAP